MNQHCVSSVMRVWRMCYTYILRDCKYAKQLWMMLIQPRYVSSFFACGLRDWLAMNLKREISIDVGSYWNLIFGVTI